MEFSVFGKLDKKCFAITHPVTASRWDHTDEGRDYYHSWEDEKYSAPEGGMVGLRNLGNTCYLNSSLQALAHAQACWGTVQG